MTFVALKDGKPTQVPKLEPEDTLEWERWKAAEVARQQRREMQAIAKQHGTPQRYLHDYDQYLDRPPAFVTSIGHPSALTPKDSYTSTFEWVFSHHANPLGITFGGSIMHWMTSCASIAVGRHSRSHLLLASIDQLHFLQPVQVGQIVTIRAIVSQVFKSSMELYVTVGARDYRGGPSLLSNECFITFVAVNERGGPVRVPDLKFDTEEERQVGELAHERRARRLKECSLLREQFTTSKNII
jgi:acyl-CoA hydrolase